MEDRNQLDRIFSYIDEQKNMGKTVAEEDIEEKNHKAQELWKEKVWRGYAELKKAGFKGGDSLFLIAAYFAGKPDKTITPLLRRLQMVMKEREDLISGGMLAASYYGMEELSMRIPVLEEGVRNLYAEQKDMEALTGSIMIADGGPAEVAKAIQWYMFFVKNGFDVKKRQMARVIGLLAVISSSPVMVGRELMNRANESIGRYENEQKDKNYMQDTFCEQVCTYIKQLQRKEQEKARKLGKTSYRMLTGEKNVTVVDYITRGRSELEWKQYACRYGTGSRINSFSNTIWEYSAKRKREYTMKKNYKMTICYDGSRYYGWEHQPDRDTIQGKLENVLTRMCGEFIDVLGAGRTVPGYMPEGWLQMQFLMLQIKKEAGERGLLMRFGII